MKYLLDSNTCIRYINGRSTTIFNKLNATLQDDMVVCSVVKAELFFGAQRSQNPEKSLAGQRQFFALFKSLLFDDSAAEHYGIIRAYLARQGTPIGGNDLLIAAIALANDVTLVTSNTREFSRIIGLRIEDWDSSG
jgi:tRNA(fMet)-specific endonuclease VapC